MDQTRTTAQPDAAALEAIGQGHLLRHAATLSGPTRERFLGEVAGFDPAELAPLIQTYVRGDVALATHARLEPADVVGLNDPSRTPARHTGEALISAGKVACFTVAGGQGSRLGYEGPKGCFPTSCVTNKPLFQIFAESIAGGAEPGGRGDPLVHHD